MTSDPSTASRADVVEALRLALPLLPALVPFGAIFATLALREGLSGWQTMLASATIVAGASQYAMLDLMGQSVPAWSILLAVAAINARHVLYSAAIGRHLGRFRPWQKALAFFVLTDPAYADAERRVHRHGSLRPSFYFAYAFCVYAAWMGGNLLGVLFGDLVGDPTRYGLDFILPIYFLSLVVGFRDTDRFVATALAGAATSILVWATLGSPWHILLGGLAGLALAAALARDPADAAATARAADGAGAPGTDVVR